MNEQTEILYDNIVLNKGANSLEIRITFDPVIPNNGGTYSLQCTLYTAVNSGCSKLTFVSPWDNSGNLSFTITAPRPTRYGVGIRGKTVKPNGQITYHIPDQAYSVYVDGEYYTTRWTISQPSTGIPIDPWFGKVYLNSGHTTTERVSFNNAVTTSAKKGDENLCTAIIGNLEKDFLITTITKGSEYLSFYDAVSGLSIGDSFNENINGLYATLKYDTPYYGTNDYDAEITTEVNGYTKTATFELIPEECGTGAPECDGEPDKPIITTKEVTFDQTVCDKSTRRGNVKPNFKSLYSQYKVNTCFNKNENKWQYEIEDNSINVEYQKTICMDNLRNLYPELLFSLNDVNTSNIPMEDACIAYKNFNAQKPYGGSSGNKYYIVEVTIKHEETHVQDLKDWVEEYSNSWKLPDVIVGYKPDCNEINNYADAEKEGKKHIKGGLQKFRNYLNEKLISHMGKNGSKERSDYEEKTQKRVGYIIEKYVKKLKTIYPNVAFVDCK
ncbi:MAG: hypothetical protein IPH62_07130 [Ignavibacteriae bacterium]|nr:hypothetical protein [Ignavibacteriota bacterium]